ncbi:MAG TPA: efflux RND transporter periplasmic adaptor subunit [Anaerolineales bacterium]|nr:efflux RND transporter periplasmic adaptor subunit [Anaerolineales bacterium]
MKPTTIVIVSIVAILVIGLAGYYGYSSSVQQQPTPAVPQTAAVSRCDVSQTVEAPGTLNNTSETEILMPADGTLAEVLVQAGDNVSAGQVLARLDDKSKAEAEIALKDAQDAYKKAYNYRVSLNGLQWNENVIIQYDNGRQVPVIKWQKGYPDAQTIQDADNDLALKKAQLEEAQSVLDQVELKSPFAGVVVEVDGVAGQPYLADTLLFKVIDPQALEVQANVTQEDYPLLKAGQSAVVYFDARPDVTAQGKVDRIVPKLVAGDSPTYDIFIALDDVPTGLADGMTVDTNITIASRQGVLCLPRSVVHASSSDQVVLQVWNGVGIEDRQVTIGLRGDSDIEIVSGLQEGDQVVVR